MNKEIYNFALNNKTILIFFLIIYSIYCSLNVGSSWDLRSHLLLGKSTFDYIFSFGKINNDSYVNLREYNSSSYWTFVYFLTQFFPKNFDLKIFNLINLSISWLTLIGFYKLGKILFNNKIGIILFLLLYFNPTFFGHMSINPKDTILAMAHIWIFYLIILYLRKQNNFYDSKKIIYKISFLLAIATGIQLYFIVSLIPIFIFLIFEIFFFKYIHNKLFNKKKFIKDLILTLIIFYFFLIFFWIDTHSNILFKPIELFISGLDASRGWPVNILNGKVFFSWEAPKYYFINLLIFKSPEFILFLYLLFIIFFIKIKNFYKTKDIYFSYKFFYLFILFIFPNILILLNPFPLYDGLRLYLWSIPYYLIIPGLTIYYLLSKIELLSIKIYFFIILFTATYHLFTFFSYTPYQYTYLNFLSGTNKNEKFESDYWGVTLKELIHKIKKNYIKKENKNIYVFFCAVPSDVIKEEISKNKIINMYSVDIKQAEYIILTNRIFAKEIKNQNKLQIDKCLNYIENNLVTVQRLNHTLSIFGKIKKN